MSKEQSHGKGYQVSLKPNTFVDEKLDYDVFNNETLAGYVKIERVGDDIFNIYFFLNDDYSSGDFSFKPFYSESINRKTKLSYIEISNITK